MEKTNLKIERAKQSMTQSDLANETGLTKQTIHLIEKCKIDPKLSTAFKIAKFFGLPIDKLFAENIEK